MLEKEPIPYMCQFMNKLFKVTITETYKYELGIEANSREEAVRKASDIYESDYDDGYLGVAQAISFDKVKYAASKATKNERGYLWNRSQDGGDKHE